MSVKPGFARIVWLVVQLSLVAQLLPVAATAVPAEQTPGAPQLWLPTPPGQPWRVIQGYGCGTHDDWDRFSLDLAAAQGRSAGAPVYAAARGRVQAWVQPSGTLILDHGNGFYTMYTHLSHAAVVSSGQIVERGEPIGLVGERGTPGVPHLHFTAYYAPGRWGGGPRQSFPLRFADGYHLSAIGGCDQHSGRVLVAEQRRVAAPTFRHYLPLVQHEQAGRPFNR